MYLPWGKRYIFTVIDHFNKLGFAISCNTKSSLSAFDFLLRLNGLAEGKISTILSNNGSGFPKYFEKACKRLKITHLFTRVRTPENTPQNEKFNRTIKEEFMEVNEYFESYLAEEDLIEANKELTDWLSFITSIVPINLFLIRH